MIVGHQKQWNFLKKKFELNQLSHAYLFAGGERLGKKSLAKEFIKLINCRGVGEKPCGVCRNCKDIEKENYPDFLMVKLKDGEQEIQISQIREVQNFLSYKSYYGSFKSVLIDNAEKMNQEAQSCFLKTLEEPKGSTILILVSLNPEMLLPTISSRCKTIKFYSVNHKEIEDYLKKEGVPEKKAGMLASLSEGKPGRAKEFLSNPEKLEREKIALETLLKITDSELAAKFQYAKSLNLENSSLFELLEILQRYFRHLLFLKTGIETQKQQNYFPVPAINLKNYSVSKILRAIRLVETINIQTSLTNVSPKLALEILLMEL